MCECDGGDGGGDGESMGEANTTVFLDSDADGGPVVAGQYLTSSVMNQVYQGLTNDTAYAVVNPDNVAVANLTAEANHIMLQEFDVDVFGTWALYLEDDWDALGLLADPVLTYEITNGPTDADPGHYARVLGDSKPEVIESVRVCDGTVSNSPSLGEPNGSYVGLDVPDDTGGLVEITMSWEATGLDEEEIAEFHLILTEEETTDPRGADARITTVDLDGTLTARIPLHPDGKTGPSEVIAECEVRGPAPRGDTEDTTVTMDAV